MVKIINSKEAADLVKDNNVLATSGFALLGVPESLIKRLEERFLEENSPKNLTLMLQQHQVIEEVKD